MNEHPCDHDPAEDVAETNLQNLLDKAYDPPSPSPSFQRELTETLVRRGTRRWWRIPLVAAAAVLIALAGWYAGQQSTPPTGEGDGSGWLAANAPHVEPRPNADSNDLFTDEAPIARENPKPPAVPLPEADFRVPTGPKGALDASLASTHLPMDAPAEANVPSLGVHQAVTTGRGEKRLVTLPDGSTLMVNEQSALRVTGRRSVTLTRGEVYLEVPHHPADGNTPETFTVRTPRRKVTALGTHFGVSARGEDTDVLVTQGQVRVDGLARKLQAGEICTTAGDVLTVRPLPRATVALDWTRQLVARANTPLVPESKHAGGRLVARTPGGGKAPLTLRKLHVDVHIEDGFARTTIVQTYFNHLNIRTEGTFLFPLPSDASLSRLAMYVAGKRMEGGMVVRERGREIYDEIVRSVQDPALLEWVDGTTFRMSVFPLEPRQEKVILLSYTQRLADEYGRQSYRFPAGHSLGKVRDWSCRIRLTDPNARWECTSHELARQADPNGQAVLTASAKNIEPTEDIVLTLTPEGAGWRAGQDIPEQTDVRSFTGSKRKYLMVRHRPKLPAKPAPRGRHWVFVHETSADRNPLLARAQIELLKGMLHCAAAGDTFQVVTAAHAAKVLTPRPLAVSRETVKTVTDALGKTHLLGALDLEAAIRSAGKLAARGENACIVYLGTARTALGSRDIGKLATQLDANVPFVGAAVGKRYNRDFLSLAARRSGGLYENIHPDEDLRWRAMELVATLNTPRLTELTASAEVDGNAVPLLGVDTMVAHGEQICVAGAVDATKQLPQAITIKGLLNGKPWQKRIACKQQDANAGYLPRLWAKLEIDRLVELYARTGEYKYRQAATELSREMYVMCPWTSLIVLENEVMYLRYEVEQGRQDHWATYPAPANMEVVYEPDERVLRGSGGWRPARQVEDPNAPRRYGESWKARLRATIRTHELASGETLVTRARKLLAGGNYKRARDVLDEALRVAPGHIEARLLSGWLTTALQATDRDSEQGRGVSLGMGSAPWYQLLRYPRSWREIARKRTRDDLGRAAIPPAEGSTRRMLQTTISNVDFQGIELEDVLAFIRDISGANILPNWEVLAGRSITRETRVTVERMRNVSAKQLLQMVLDSAGGTQVELDYAIRDGNVHISTADAMRGRAIQRVYDVRGLVPETVQMPDDVRPILTAEDRRVAARQLGQVISMVKEITPLDSWVDQGGPGSLRVFPGYLMVNHTQEMHDRIGDLLTMLRYPQDWPARKAMQRWLALRHQGESSANIRARQALAQRITIPEKTRVKLSAFVDFLRDVTGHNVYVEWSRLDDRGVSSQSEATVPAGKAIRVKDLAESVLGQLDGGRGPFAIILEDGLIRITTREAAQHRTVHRMYDIRDLLAPSPHTPRPTMSMREAIEEMMETPDDRSGLFGDDDGDEIDWIRPRNQRGTRIYDLRDLTIPIPDFRGPSTDIDDFADENSGGDGLFGDDDDDGFSDDYDDFESEPLSQREDRLLSVFREAAPLDVWVEQGGPASLRFFRGQLVVNAPRETHRIVREILDVLRQTYHPQPAGPMLIQVGCGRLASLDLSKTHFDRPTAYAPGFITTLADVAAVLESEGPHQAIPFGEMDNAAADHLDAARGTARRRSGDDGWSVATRPGETIVFHDDGRYAITRTAGAGLKERVFCDGQSLWHVYPELGLATHRRVSRFHRLAAGFEVPWLIPSNTVLQKGASVEHDGNGVIVSRPLKGGPCLRPALRLELSNAAVARHEWVHAGRAIRGISVQPNGLVVETLPGGHLRRRRYTFSEAKGPPKQPDLTDLVVLEMPIRSPQHVLTSRHLDPIDLLVSDNWPEADALAYVAATALPAPSPLNWHAEMVIRERFFRKGDRRAGLAILAMVGGSEPNVPSAVAKTDVGRYIRLADGDSLAKGETWTDPNGFLAELAKLRALWSRLHAPDAPHPDAERIAAALNTLAEVRPSVVSWAVASEVGEHAVTVRHRRKLAAIMDAHADALEQVRIAAGYTAARALAAAGARGESADRFETLIAAMAEDTVAPIVDEQIRRTLGAKRWARALTSAARTLQDANAVMPAMQLAWMAIRAGDRDGGLAVLEDSVWAAPRTDRILAAVTALEICRSLREWALAERMVAELQDVPRVVRSAGFWRIAATTALQHGNVTEYGLRLARALRLDYRSGKPLPAGRFMEEHRLTIEALANAARTVTRDDTDTRRALATEIVRLADRARVAFPSASPGILEFAGRGLMRLGAHELAWGYFTTPLAGRGHNADAWDYLARQMERADRHALAADAKLIAARLWPDSLEAALEAGEMLELANRIDEAVVAYRHALTRKGEDDWDRRTATEIADRLKALTGEEVQLPDRLKD